jgi:hypothetical protein
VLQSYGGSYRKALVHLFPDIGLDETKFQVMPGIFYRESEGGRVEGSCSREEGKEGGEIREEMCYIFNNRKLLAVQKQERIHLITWTERRSEKKVGGGGSRGATFLLFKQKIIGTVPKTGEDTLNTWPNRRAWIL